MTTLRQRRALHFGTGVCLLAAASSALAEGNPYKVGAALAVGSDSNLFRAPQGAEVSDRFVTASVFGEIDQPIGRQRLQAGLTLRHSTYQDRSDLDSTGYGLKLNWSGSTLGELSWQLGYDANRRLAAYTGANDAALRIANMETTQELGGTVQLGMVSQWVAIATASHREVAYSAAAYAGDELRLDALGVSAQWNPAGPLSATVGPRFTRGRYPQSSDATRSRFKREDIDFGLRWVPSGASTITSRLSLTRQRYEPLDVRDFNGATGKLDWQWAVTGKTRVFAAISRDTGSESTFLNAALSGATLRGSGDNSQISNSLGVRIENDVTGKITARAAATYLQRRLSASTLSPGNVVGFESGIDRSAGVAFGLSYAPTRNSQLACDIGYERRGTRTVLSSAYRARTALCSAQLALN